MDRWLAAIDADESHDLLPMKIVRNKPADLSDGGWAPDSKTIELSTQTRDLDYCLDSWYPVSSTPRIVAAKGDHVATFVTKCQLKPLVDPNTRSTSPKNNGPGYGHVFLPVWPIGVNRTSARRLQFPGFHSKTVQVVRRWPPRNQRQSSRVGPEIG
jgi:hypothetical protein